MNRNKIFQRAAAIFMIIASLLFVTVVHAQIQTYEGVGEYFMTNETVEFAKEQAELEAQRNVLEQVCVYVRGQATMIDHELDEDEIITISAGILYWKDVKFSCAEDSGDLLVKALVKAEIDTDEVDKLLDNAIKNR